MLDIRCIFHLFHCFFVTFLDMERIFTKIDLNTVRDNFIRGLSNDCLIIKDMDLADNDPLTFFLIQQIFNFLLVKDLMSQNQKPL